MTTQKDRQYMHWKLIIIIGFLFFFNYQKNGENAPNVCCWFLAMFCYFFIYIFFHFSSSISASAPRSVALTHMQALYCKYFFRARRGAGSAVKLRQDLGCVFWLCSQCNHRPLSQQIWTGVSRFLTPRATGTVSRRDNRFLTRARLTHQT